MEALRARFPTVYDWRELERPDVESAETDLVLVKRPDAFLTRLIAAGNPKHRLPEAYARCHLILFGSNSDSVMAWIDVDDRPAYTSAKCTSQAFDLPMLSPQLHAVRERALFGVEDVRGWVTLTTRHHGDRSALRAGAIALSVVPEDGIVGAVTMRPSTSTGLAWLPWDVPNPLEWIDAIVAEWAEVDREAFASIVPWREDPNWMTSDEKAILADRAALDEDQRRAEAEFARRSNDIAHRMSEARVAADHGARALLTTQDEPLVQAVAAVLRTLGFEVEDMDLTEKKGQMHEDLRVRFAANPGWEAVVEIKGFKHGNAKEESLRKLTRHAHHYFKEKGHDPSARWLVVNGQFELPPGLRHRPYEATPDVITDFGQNYDGLIIGTVDLFRVLADPSATHEQIRTRLLDGRGRFEWPPHAP